MLSHSIIGIFFISCISLTKAANILAILPVASPSHHILYSPYIVELANRGHNITLVSPIAQKTKITNLTDLKITGLFEELNKELTQESNYEDFVAMPNVLGQYLLFNFWVSVCEKSLKSKAWEQLMDYPSDTKFDLVILEAIGAECLIGSIQKFGIPPIVLLNGFMVPQWMFELVGTPNVVSHIPHYGATFNDRMSFHERAKNLLYNTFDYLMYHYWYLPKMDKMAKENFGPNIPSFREISGRICLGMANFHHVLDYSWAKTPNLVPIAGIQVREPKQLPTDLQKYLDEAIHGAIFFSLGSHVLSKNISPKKKQAILDAFSELPLKVLWKFEDDSLSALPPNVKLGKWLPQSDILAHPNIKLFISHSGYLSTVETVYRGVPVMGIPFFGDQPQNIQKLMKHGAALRFNFNDLTKETFKEAIITVLNNSSYKENMLILSRRLKDNPETPLERAVYWTEYVLRHKGAYHMRSAAIDLNFAQYFLLDIIAFVRAIPIVLLSVLYCLCCRRKKNIHTKLKKN